MAEQMTIFDEIPDAEITTEALFTPNGPRRCEHCRGRLVAFGGRLLCANPNCPGGAAR